MEHYLYSEFKKDIIELSESPDEERLMEAYAASADILLLIEKGLPGKDFIINKGITLSTNGKLDIEREKNFWTKIQKKVVEDLYQKDIDAESILTPLLLQEISQGPLGDFNYEELVIHLELAGEFDMPEAESSFQAEIDKRYPYVHLSKEEIIDLMIDGDSKTREQLQQELISRNGYGYGEMKKMFLSDNSWREQGLEELDNRAAVLNCFVDFFLSKADQIRKDTVFDFHESFFLYFDQEIKNTNTEILSWMGALYDVYKHLKEKFGIEYPVVEKQEISEEDLRSCTIEDLCFFFDVFSYRPDIYERELVIISNLLNK